MRVRVKKAGARAKLHDIAEAFETWPLVSRDIGRDIFGVTIRADTPTIHERSAEPELRIDMTREEAEALCSRLRTMLDAKDKLKVKP